MRPTLLLEGLRNIRSRKTSFLTLCLIITLGLGGFCAAQFAERSMVQAGSGFFRRSAFKDFDVISSAGIAESEIARFRAVDGVEEVEGRYSAEALYTFGNTDQAVMTLSLTKRVSMPQLTVGRLPERHEECLVDPDLLSDSGAKIGDTITLAGQTRTGGSISGQYVVTGTACHPDYLRRDTVYPVILLPEVYDPAGLGLYESASVTVRRDGDAQPFSEDYFEQTKDIRHELEALAEDLSGAAPVSDGAVQFPLPAGNRIVLDRRSNAGYTEYRSTIGAVSGAGTSFGLLFLFVTAMECFSTILLLVEDQKKLVGIEKAFGFRPPEVLVRYLTFGIGAAGIGIVLGLALACGLGRLLLFLLDKTELYVFPAEGLVAAPLVMLCVSLGVVAVCALTSVFACRSLLRSSADELMRGRSAGDQRLQRKRRKEKETGSLFRRLIIRNILREKGRVAMTVIVTAASCVLIGASVTVKLAYDGMNIRQLEEVWLYDLRVDLGQQTDPSAVARMEETMDALGADWVRAGLESRLFVNGDRLDGTYVLCAAADDMGRIIGLSDPETGRRNVPGDTGMLIQYRMAENLSLHPGDRLEVLDGQLGRREGTVSGVIQNYQKRIIALTPEAYLETFGAEAPYNCFYVRLGDVEEQEFRDEFLAVNDSLGFERADSFFEQYRAIAFMYNIVVLAVMIIAILISFVILVNMAAIFVSRRRPELIDMRINGFYPARTKAYLACEAAATTFIGLALGVVCGIPVGRLAVRFMETPDVMFVRQVQPAAWVIAIVLESAFAIAIYGTAMRRVGAYSLTSLDEAV